MTRAAFDARIARLLPQAVAALRRVAPEGATADERLAAVEVLRRHGLEAS